MAKRGIDEHPKVIEFAELLGIPVCYAIGPLELFWHWVAKYKPQGNITGVKASAIGHSIRFPGEATQLMDALIGSGLVDVLPDGRSVVHDWSEHADNSVHQLLKKRGEVFADGCEPFTRNRARTISDSQTVHKQFTNGSRLPEPEPEPDINSLSASMFSPKEDMDVSDKPTKEKIDWESHWEEFRKIYPKRHGDLGVTPGKAKFKIRIRDGIPPSEIIQGARNYRAFCDRNGKTGTAYVKQIPTWLNQETWREYQFQPETQQLSVKQLTDQERENLER